MAGHDDIVGSDCNAITDGATFGDNAFRYSAFGQGRFEINDYWDWGFGLESIHDDEYLRRYDLDGYGERRGPYVGNDTRLVSQLFAIGQSERSYSAVSLINFQDLREPPPLPDNVDVRIPPVEGTKFDPKFPDGKKAAADKPAEIASISEPTLRAAESVKTSAGGGRSSVAGVRSWTAVLMAFPGLARQRRDSEEAV